jgi:hypothetical protein
MVAAMQHMTRCMSTAALVLIAFFGPRNLLLGNTILFSDRFCQLTGANNGSQLG